MLVTNPARKIKAADPLNSTHELIDIDVQIGQVVDSQYFLEMVIGRVVYGQRPVPIASVSEVSLYRIHKG
jgi:hypothetical protein